MGGERLDRALAQHHAQGECHVCRGELFLHGDRDPRVPMRESDAMVAAMEERQKKVKYEKFEYAGHGFIRPDHRRRVYAEVAAFFHEHLAEG